jgi:hypothetical protein
MCREQPLKRDNCHDRGLVSFPIHDLRKDFSLIVTER